MASTGRLWGRQVWGQRGGTQTEARVSASVVGATLCLTPHFQLHTVLFPGPSTCLPPNPLGHTCPVFDGIVESQSGKRLPDVLLLDFSLVKNPPLHQPSFKRALVLVTSPLMVNSVPLSAPTPAIGGQFH